MAGHLRKSVISVALLALMAAPASAKSILLTNDDGLTSNLVALYNELKLRGHDVIVSVPCTGQSGMGAAIYFLRPLGPLDEPCLNNAAEPGAPGAGAMTREGLGPDFFYVNGTPVMALLYGLDIQAQERWGSPPDLVLSGPNEGRNIGYIVVSSGTVSNAQYAAMRGIPAIAFSAGEDTRDNTTLASPKSREVADLAADFVDRLAVKAAEEPIMPPGTALNVNFPDDLEAAQWVSARIGSYNTYSLKFVADLSQEPAASAFGLKDVKLPGISVSIASPQPSEDQAGDEAVVSKQAISVSVMQIAYDGNDGQRAWLASTMAAMTAPPGDQGDAVSGK